MNEFMTGKKFDDLAERIAQEFANQNLFPIIDFQSVLCDEKHSLYEDCVELLEYLVSRSETQEELIQKCAEVILQKTKGIDEHIQALSNKKLFCELGIKVDKHFLVNLSDNRLEIRTHGVIFDESVLIYPHQFLRRFYSANFVGMPAILKQAVEAGLEVSIRLDSLRKTTPDRYREIFEFDHWHGSPFSEELLKDKRKRERTVHYSRGLYSFSYDAKFTVFRTNMLDTAIRQFMIEEYCPILLPNNEKSPGVGERYCIQKFAHCCYDQSQDCFTHLDGAVRVFSPEEYHKYFNTIENGKDIDPKAGTRQKMFLVEGKFDQTLAQRLLTEWFRCNPHIQEYFSGLTIEPHITYEQYDSSIKPNL